MQPLMLCPACKVPIQATARCVRRHYRRHHDAHLTDANAAWIARACQSGGTGTSRKTATPKRRPAYAAQLPAKKKRERSWRRNLERQSAARRERKKSTTERTVYVFGGRAVRSVVSGGLPSLGKRR